MVWRPKTRITVHRRRAMVAEFPMDETAIEEKLETGDARQLEPGAAADHSGNPAVRALPKVERDVLALHGLGLSFASIGQHLGISKHDAYCAWRAASAKIRFLAVVKEILLCDPCAFSGFMSGRVCQFCPARHCGRCRDC
jgi:hypothetical protein